MPGQDGWQDGWERGEGGKGEGPALPTRPPTRHFRGVCCPALQAALPALHVLPVLSVLPLQYHELDTVEVAIPALNSLLKSPAFWAELAAAGVAHTLFFQTDSLLVHGGIQPFLQVGGRAGAVWVRGWVGGWVLHGARCGGACMEEGVVGVVGWRAAVPAGRPPFNSASSA